MPIDPSQALGAAISGGTFAWDRDRVILYHLGVGAGVPQTDANELAYTYERDLKVLPSFGVIPAFGSLGGLGAVPGLSFNPALLLHGEQDLEVLKPIPVTGEVESAGKVAGLYDKGKAALAVLEMTSRLKGESEPLFVNRFSLFLRGEGGFGGESGPPPGNEAPARAPDFTIESKTLPQQALLYRLSGDKNPLHADPAVREDGRLRCAHPPRPLFVRHRLQGGGGCRARRCDRERRSLPGALRGRRLSRRDHRDKRLARGREAAHRSQNEGARHGRHLERRHHDALGARPLCRLLRIADGEAAAAGCLGFVERGIGVFVGVGERPFARLV